MSRHTLADGTTPDETIKTYMFDEHRPLLAPASRLVGAYYRGVITWTELAAEYRRQLAGLAIDGTLSQLAREAQTDPVNLLCTETDPNFCHRRLLAETVKELFPEVEVEIG
ncbi:DUF488 domain-containing protein [Candidatus Microgenomates bacterium]|nr:DUF488 domain-containing protein [Candidatus Microgenomates bacterium]